MALTLRPTQLEKSPAFRHLADYTVHKDSKLIGRMYERHAPGSLDRAWHWSITEYVDPVLGSVTSRQALVFSELMKYCVDDSS